MIDYNYNGALEPVKVKVVTFHSIPDFILSLQQWQDAGGLKGLIKDGTFWLGDVKKVITGQMCPVEFDSLGAWEG